MNLAILLGVDEYNLTNNNLPGCKNDIKLMSELINNMKKFNDVLVINENSNSRDIKNKILNFMKKYSDSNETIEDFFFYFTGHGKFYQDDFYYLLTDFHPNKIKQTSLENSELDIWIRELNPKTTIKVIDACYSGVPYIKDIPSVESILGKGIKQINNCYFMSSSKLNETSKQSEVISYFTASFLNSILNCNGGELRYKEIVDYISDDFTTIDDQTPYFVCQGDHTALFGDITDELKKKIQDLYNSFTLKSDDNNNLKTNRNLIDLIKSDADRYCSKDEMLKNIDNIKLKITDYNIKNNELKQLYEVKAKFYRNHPIKIKTRTLGKWVDKNSNYFARPTYDKEEYTEIIQVKKPNAFTNILGGALGGFNYEDKEITKYRDVISGFELTQEVPYNCIEISYKPNFENIKYYSMFILFIFSKTDIVFFTYNSYYEELNWDKIILNLDSNWNINKIPAKEFDKIDKFIDSIIIQREDTIFEELNMKFNVTEVNQLT